MHGLPGHGVGRALHEWPTVPTVYRRIARERLPEGQVMTIEPHIALGAGGMVTAPDTWTLRTQDGTPDEVTTQIEAYRNARIDHVLLWFMDAPQQDGTQLFIDAVMPRFRERLVSHP